MKKTTKPETNKLLFTISSLKPLDPNPRRHNERNIEAIKASLAEHGQVTPIVVDKDKIVRKGNGTLEAAKQLGWTEVWVVPYSEAFNADGTESDVRLRKYALQDNRTGETSDWDLELLQQDFQWLLDANIELQDVGWEPHESEPIIAADWAPQVNSSAVEQELNQHSRANIADPIMVTADQRESFEAACQKLKDGRDIDLSEGECLEIICNEFVGA